MMSSSASRTVGSATSNESKSTRSRRKTPEGSPRETKKAKRDSETGMGGANGDSLSLVMVLAAPFLNCRDIGKLFFCTSKSLLAAVVESDGKEEVYKMLCFQYWGACAEKIFWDPYSEEKAMARVKAFVEKTGLGSWERCFRELSHFKTIRRRPHKYFTPFEVADSTAPPPLTMDPSNFTLVVDVRRANTVNGKRLFCAALTGSQLTGLFKYGVLQVKLADRRRRNTMLTNGDMAASTTNTNTTNAKTTAQAGGKVFPWDARVYLIRRSDQTVVKLMDLHETDTLLSNTMIQENNSPQASRHWDFQNCLVPEPQKATSRIGGLVISSDPPHERLSLASLFGRGNIRMGLVLTYARTDTSDLSSPFYISRFSVKANLLSRSLRREVPLVHLLCESSEWHFCHVLQAMNVFSNDVQGNDD